MMTATQNNTGWNKQKKKLLLRVLLGILILLILYGYFIEPSWLEVKQVSITLNDLPTAFKGYRIVQVSDIHFGTAFSDSRLRNVVTEVNRQQPDVVVLTGDFLSDKYESKSPAQTGAIKQLTEILQGIKARNGIYAVWGNHDRFDRAEVQSNFSRIGIKILCNESQYIEKNGDKIMLIGMDDAWRTVTSPRPLLKDNKQGECVIALVHRPDPAEYNSQFPIALQISGHMHGGQINFPGARLIQSIYVRSKYREGLFNVGKMQLLVSRGIGMTGLPFRFGARPEIICLTLN